MGFRYSPASLTKRMRRWAKSWAETPRVNYAAGSNPTTGQGPSVIRDDDRLSMPFSNQRKTLMGEALAIFFAVCVLFVVLGNNSDESAAIKKQTKDLPEGASIFFDKVISGHSRKGVITYYSHFVRAIYRAQDGSTHQELFHFSHHSTAEKASAWGDAHSWVIKTHANLTSKSNTSA